MIEPIIYLSAAAITLNDPKPGASGATGLIGKIIRRLRQYHRKWFQNRNYIFVHQGPFEPARAHPCAFVRYDRFEDTPDHMRKAIEIHGGEKALETDRREMEQAAIMWAAIFDGQLAGILFTRRGRDFQRWFVKLQEDDIVIFRVRTYPQFRGQGIAPSLMHYAMYSLLHQGDNAYIDCRVYNTPSIRAIQKTGFERFATMKPITRQEALGKK